MTRRIREWTLHEEIGRGGMGIVYRATHDLMPGTWAIKVLKSEIVEDPENRERFLKEIAHLTLLQHPGIVQIQTPIHEQGQLFLPMELLSGQPLADLLKELPGQWPPAQALDIILQVSAAVGFAHRRDIIHRDIKPANIQILPDGVVKILDFGLSRQSGDRSLTASGTAVGTPAYMAPEVLAGQKATPRSDVFAIGLVLYQMLAGRLPFEMPASDSSVQAIYYAVIMGHQAGIPDIRQFVPSISPPLADLTMAALSRDPALRPSDAMVLHEQLTRLAVRDRLGSEFIPDSSPTGDRTMLHINLPVESQSPTSERKARPSTEANRLQPVVNPPRPGAGHSRHLSVLIPAALAGMVLMGGLTWWFGIESPKRAEVARVAAAEEAARIERENAEEARRQAEAAAQEAERQRKAALKSRLIESLDTNWVTIPGGGFMMGAERYVNEVRADGKPIVSPDELPTHWVTVPTFQIGRGEITVEQFRMCVEAGACKEPLNPKDERYCENSSCCTWLKPGLDKFPVNCVSWDQAIAFARFAEARLPSESEWEYAARGGGMTQDYAWGDQEPDCNLAVMLFDRMRGCGDGRPARPCSRPAGNTIHGLCDMSGNLYEWTQDYFHYTYAGAPTDGSAWDDRGQYRIFRGGSWTNTAPQLRVVNRGYDLPETAHHMFGLRLARTIR
ncbi:MAG TPA: bifunctional serine/threonine-protein kinase/formylglycine-generating enzyme family protein [Myxococcota bacterium]|nr:SUMF1/EgtB/PvdO family nonheme iron enzyme [Myxococcota bacterium]HNZ03288.1 bifunctional serine/threonine-protein kinase/formylglycine-generating enzyme family protein [Myxococcota bacterium]HQP96323.1 bifunctional serine/threonine-protein kinase/formylglycine-generating enzyme family protein [Myxococcota bacterium]